jgi:hypothetical protein
MAAAVLLLASTPVAWAQSNDANERQIAANKTATAAAHATFEAQNAGAIARHGAAEPTQTQVHENGQRSSASTETT